MGYIDHIIAQTNGADPTGAWRKFAQDVVFTDEEIKNGSFYKLVPGLIDVSTDIYFNGEMINALKHFLSFL